jgi:hypothetical protein
MKLSLLLQLLSKRTTMSVEMMLHNACSVGVRIYIDDSFDPAKMWKTLDEKVNTAGTSVGRAALYNAFTTIKPTPGHPIGDFFTKLLEIRNQNIGTSEAIPDMMFKSHVFHSLPEVFDITVRMLPRETCLEFFTITVSKISFSNSAVNFL